MGGVTIVGLDAADVRFPTSRGLHGSDALNVDPDYSAAYVTLRTDRDDGLDGHGLTFTTGRGNEVCVAAIRSLAPLVVGESLDRIRADMRGFWRRLTSDSQLRWLGPEKGVIHLATAAIVNAVWDLWAKTEGKPLWRLLVDLSPEELVGCVDFRYIDDVLAPEEALEIVRDLRRGRDARIETMLESGYPAYTTSAGWLGYDDSMVESLVEQAVTDGFRHVKMKVGADLEADDRRAALIRRSLGPDGVLMMDANQAWGVDEAISAMRFLGHHDPWWIEEPTSPDDILGHARIRREIDADSCRDRRARSEPHRLQAVVSGQGDRCLSARCLQSRRRERGDRDPSSGREVRGSRSALTRAESVCVSTCSTWRCSTMSRSADRSRTGLSNGSITFTSISPSLRWCAKGGISPLELPGTASKYGRNRSPSTPSLTAPSGRTSRPAASP